MYIINLLRSHSWFSILINQFKNVIVWVLIIATLISVFLGEYVDGIAIGVILILNAILGFVQEFKAEKAIEALQKMASLKAKVLRDGEEHEIDAKDIVQGDILILEEGDKIPADCTLLESLHMEANEASLTGE